ncbi:MAG: Holliday junction branch migration protein RuvA [Candidatus Lernaella stagnicola]|nr:Holliday junction branch migration protein RuvA [Candidatus Lernaella stagnicola]
MIARLAGRLAEKELTRVVVDVGGVGYAVNISANCFYALPEPPAEVTLLIHTSVREDDISLYGFLTALEKNLFRHLVSVSNVGPRAAMNLLSAFKAEDLLSAIANQDAKALSTVTGIGKKTAERILVDLGDKAGKLLAEAEIELPAPPSPLSVAERDALSALVNLGFRETEAESAVARARQVVGPDAGLEDLIRAALRRHAKG